MPRGSLLGDDEELGKKDDDYRAGHDDLILSDLFQFKWLKWDAKPGPRTQRRRRRALMTGGGLVAGFVLLLILLLRDRDASQTQLRSWSRQPFQVNLDDLELDPAHQADIKLDPKHAAIHQPGSDAASNSRAPPRNQQAPKGPPPEPAVRGGRELQYYDGPLTFHALPASLQSISSGRRMRFNTGNVLFAAANPQSFAQLAPMACEMARWQRSTVHFAVMGRHELKIEELKTINGVDKGCEVKWHDARPDYAAYSTDDRFGLAVHHGLESINSYIQPSAFIIDQHSEEEPRFLKALEDYTSKVHRPIIRLPTNAGRDLKWMTRLDPGSLAAWNTAQVEVLVRATTGNGKSLVRLLKSIQRADYFGSRPPHLTIELPPDLEPRTEKFLDNFVWPPSTPRGEQHESLLTLRRRLPQQRIGIVEASMRLIESFYPSRPHDSHVLLLAPVVELSPLYYHYLFYNLLEYKYSTYNTGSRESTQLLGISLYSPTHLLDGRTKLLRPTVPVEGTRRGRADDEALTKATPFLWQAPDTYATLYFGDKWKQLLFFFNERLRRTDLTDNSRLITAAVPAFAEYFLELMRARGWSVLYPHLPGYDFATKHNDLYQPPEEFADTGASDTAEDPLPNGADPFYHPGPTTVPKPKEEELAYSPLDILLPSEGDLMELAGLPLLSYNGQQLTAASADRQKDAYAQLFRTSVGKCPETPEKPAPTTDYSADDLFCDSNSAMKQLGTPPLVDDGLDGTEHRPINDLSGHYAASRHPSGGVGQWIDEDGEWLPLPISDDEQQSMNYEFSKHLERQKDRSE